ELRVASGARGVGGNLRATWAGADCGRGVSGLCDSLGCKAQELCIGRWAGTLLCAERAKQSLRVAADEALLDCGAWTGGSIEECACAIGSRGGHVSFC